MPAPPFRLYANPADAHLQHDGYPLDMDLMNIIFHVRNNLENFVFGGKARRPQADANYSSVAIAVNGVKRHILPGYVLEHTNRDTMAAAAHNLLLSLGVHYDAKIEAISFYDPLFDQDHILWHPGTCDPNSDCEVPRSYPLLTNTKRRGVLSCVTVHIDTTLIATARALSHDVASARVNDTIDEHMLRPMPWDGDVGGF